MPLSHPLFSSTIAAYCTTSPPLGRQKSHPLHKHCFLSCENTMHRKVKHVNASNILKSIISMYTSCTRDSISSVRLMFCFAFKDEVLLVVFFSLTKTLHVPASPVFRNFLDGRLGKKYTHAHFTQYVPGKLTLHGNFPAAKTCWCLVKAFFSLHRIFQSQTSDDLSTIWLEISTLGKFCCGKYCLKFFCNFYKNWKIVFLQR